MLHRTIRNGADPRTPPRRPIPMSVPMSESAAAGRSGRWPIASLTCWKSTRSMPNCVRSTRRPLARCVMASPVSARWPARWVRVLSVHHVAAPRLSDHAGDGRSMGGRDGLHYSRCRRHRPRARRRHGIGARPYGPWHDQFRAESGQQHCRLILILGRAVGVIFLIVHLRLTGIGIHVDPA